MLPLGLLTMPLGQQQAKEEPATFVIAVAGTDNGFAYISGYINSVYNKTLYYNEEFYTENTDSELAVEVGDNVTLAVFVWFNATKSGVSSLNEGLLYLRHNISVLCLNHTEVFSKQNFTYIIGTDGGAPMYFYRHDVILDFAFDAGEIYTATITYEVFY
jgi:hypothetical protein